MEFQHPPSFQPCWIGIKGKGKKWFFWRKEYSSLQRLIYIVIDFDTPDFSVNGRELGGNAEADLKGSKSCLIPSKLDCSVCYTLASNWSSNGMCRYTQHLIISQLFDLGATRRFTGFLGFISVFYGVNLTA